MKTILINGTYSRVSNEVADTEVRFGRAKFAPKSEWKTNVRTPQRAESAKAAAAIGEQTKQIRAEKRSKIHSKQRPADYTDKFIK